MFAIYTDIELNNKKKGVKPTGFKSRWAYPKLCKYATADTIWRKNFLDSVSESLFFSTVNKNKIIIFLWYY